MKATLTRRNFLRVSLGAIGATALAACAAPTGPQAGGAQPSTAQKELSFAWWTGGEAANKLFEEAVDHFEEQHPTYKINRISMPGAEFATKILTMYGSGNAPDAHGVGWGTVWSWAHKGILLDLTSFVERDASAVDWEGMWPAVTGGCYYPADKIIALPRESFGLMLHIYNKKIFADAGVETPDKAMDTDAWTWQAWREKAKALTKFDANGRREIMGANTGNADYWDLQVVMPSYGVPMFNKEQTHFNLDDEKVVNWLKMLPEMINVERSLGKPSETGEFDWGASGKQAIVQSATWNLPNMKETWQALDWDFVPPPKGDCCHANFVGSDYHVVNGSEYADREGGWELIKFLNSPKEDLWWALHFFGAPFRKSNVDAWSRELNNQLPKAGWKYSLAMTEKATPWTPIPFQDELNVILSNEIGQAVSGERPVDEVVASVSTKLDDMIKNFK
ncbi:MAG: extracellular solute-binding protein [Chloroflexi bacterium]|nr:extracellular solute-binding protein [Chloroflexota bacterium]